MSTCDVCKRHWPESPLVEVPCIATVPTNNGYLHPSGHVTLKRESEQVFACPAFGKAYPRPEDIPDMLEERVPGIRARYAAYLQNAADLLARAFTQAAPHKNTAAGA